MYIILMRFTHCDFVIKYNPETDTERDIALRIFYSIIVKPLKNKKPRVIFLGGDSGEGKSLTAITIQEMIMECQHRDIMPIFDVMNVCTPLEYPQKIEKILFNKDYKEANMITIHEARDVVRAKLWQSFLTQAIADINAMSRSIKRLCVIIISQFIRDITSDIRYTLNYYMKVQRPLGKKARLYINVLWKDDRDLEKPKLRKRRLSGYLVYPDGHYQRFVPKYLELSMPRDELVKRFDELDTAAKSITIKGKIERLMSEMQAEVGTKNNKIGAMVEWYSQSPDRLADCGKRFKNQWKIKPEMKELHNLTEQEVRTFETSLNKRIKEKGFIQQETQSL